MFPGHGAVSRDPADRAVRIRRMRVTIREHDIYRWAGEPSGKLSRLRSTERDSGVGIAR